MFQKITWLAIFILSISINAQEKNEDTTLICATIKNYFDGYIHQDSLLLQKAFDMENGAMKVPGTDKRGKEIVVNRYFRDLIPKWASREPFAPEIVDNSVLEIQNIDVVDGKISSAKISMKVGETTYIDILSLQKIKQDWKITNKIFVVRKN